MASMRGILTRNHNMPRRGPARVQISGHIRPPLWIAQSLGRIVLLLVPRRHVLLPHRQRVPWFQLPEQEKMRAAHCETGFAMVQAYLANYLSTTVTGCTIPTTEGPSRHKAILCNLSSIKESVKEEFKAHWLRIRRYVSHSFCGYSGSGISSPRPSRIMSAYLDGTVSLNLPMSQTQQVGPTQ